MVLYDFHGAIIVELPSHAQSLTYVGIPSCPISGTSVTAFDYDGATVTWQQPPNTPPVTFTTVTYCPTSSPNCGNSVNCTSPCNITGLDSGTEYQFTVIPNNNCGSPTGCTGNMATAEIACEYKSSETLCLHKCPSLCVVVYVCWAERKQGSSDSYFICAIFDYFP